MAERVRSISKLQDSSWIRRPRNWLPLPDEIVQKLKEAAQRADVRSACLLFSDEAKAELVFANDRDIENRVARLRTEQAKAIGLMTCATNGEVSTTFFDAENAASRELMSEMLATFEAVHYARLLYPNLE